MDTRLLRKLRKEARNVYGVEKIDNREFAVIAYTSAGKCVISKYNTFGEARFFCDLERANTVYCMVLKMRAAIKRHKRIY